MKWIKAASAAVSVVLIAALSGALSFVAPAGATSGSITMTASAPPSVLYGTTGQVTLSVSNSTSTPEYNLSFEDVLPSGVGYVSGSTSPAEAGVGNPTVIHNEPSTGKTTLIWSNVADVEPASTQSISFRLTTVTGATAATDALLPGSSYTTTPTAYLNSTPRTVPEFSSTGTPVAASYTASARPTATPSTLISPIAVTKSDSSPTAKLVRGVHDHPDVYTLVVTNNSVLATDAATVHDWLPAGLEFLGCGGVDNTTTASGTNLGSKYEYPGAPALGKGADATQPRNCLAPSVVTTVKTTPPDGQPTGVYTEVEWSIGDLAPGATTTIEYYAAVPLRSNTLTWAGGIVPGTTGAQTANLNNNNGPETYDGESLTNTAEASGTYTGPLGGGATNPVSAVTSHTVIAHDLAVEKTVGTPTFTAGKAVSFDLDIQTSEYRYTTSPVLTDVVPNGLCPIDSTTNYTRSGTSECKLQATHNPVLINNTTGVSTTLPYSTVGEGAGGTFTITWGLPALPPNTNDTVKYWVVDRTSYQKTFASSTPVLAGDSLTNTVTIAGTTHTTCYVPGTSPTPSPLCTASGAKVIYTHGQAPSPVHNGSSASQQSPQPTIIKRISVPPVPSATLTCATATYEATPAAPYPVYQKGDKICFQLEVAFPAGSHTGSPLVTDFLPPNTSYVATSAKAVTGNTVHIATVGTTHAATGVITWTLGTRDASSGEYYAQPGQEFLVDMAVTATATPTAGNDYNLNGNLMKFTSIDTAGAATSLRSQATYRLSRPVLGLTKGVAEVTQGGVVTHHTPPTTHVEVEDGAKVTYRVGLTNSGLEPASDTTVWDDLPKQISSCTEVSAISNSGTCVAGTPPTIEWSGITVPAASDATPPVPATLTPALSYVVTVPDTVTAGETLTNKAGVVSYAASSDESTTLTEIPGTNIDLTHVSVSWNSPAADATASVYLASATLTKTEQGTVNGAGKATIGEPVVYTVTATIPAGTTISTAKLTDPLDAHCPTSSSCLAYTSASATLNGTAVASGFILSHTGNTVTLAFPATFSAPATPAGGQVVVLTVDANVQDVAGLVRGHGLDNTATLTYKTSQGNTVTRPATADTAIVEPDLKLVKTNSPSGPFAPGSTVTYTVDLGNCVTAKPFTCAANDVSSASDIVVTDTLPKGETPVTTTISNAGTAAETSTVWTITWTLTSPLAAGSHLTLTYTATVPNPVVGSTTFTNNVRATATSLDTTTYPDARTTGTGYEPTAQDTVKTVGPTVAKTATPTSVTNGVVTTYTATVKIPADLKLPNLTAIDTLPDGTTFDGYGIASCTDTTGTCGGQVVDTPLGTPAKATTGTTRLAWYIGTLTSNPGVRTVTLHYSAYPSKSYHTGSAVLVPAAFKNSIGVYWNATAKAAPTSIPAPSAYTYSSALAHATVTLIGPKLSVKKVSSTTTPTPGVPFTYTVTLKNTGNGVAYVPEVTDTLPKGLVFQAGSTTSTLSGVTTGDTIQATGETDITWTYPAATTIAAGAGATITYQAELGPSGTLSSGQALVNKASIPAYYGVPKATYTSTTSRYVKYGPAASTVTVHATFPALHMVKKVVTSGTAIVGKPFHWDLTVTDTTVAPAEDVPVSDTLPKDWTYDTGSTQITLAAGTVVTGVSANPTVTHTASTSDIEILTWSGTTLAGVSETHPVTIDYTATPNRGVAKANTNTALASGKDATTATGDKTGPYTSNTATASVDVAMANLQIVKTIGTTGGPVAGTSKDTYDIAVKNDGPDAAAGPIVVDDTAPAGTTLTGGLGTGWSCSVATAGASISCTRATSLTSGTSAPQLVIDVDIPAGYVISHGASITNTATVASPTYDPTPANNTSTVKATVGTKADLSITKSHTGNLTPGTDAAYTIRVQNLGPSDSPTPGTSIAVTDTLPAGETFVSAAGTGWTCAHVGQKVTCTLGTGLAASASTAFNLTVAVAPTVTPGKIANTATITRTTVTDPNPVKTSKVTNTVVTSADLAISKTATATDTFTPGTTVKYTLAVRNNGPSYADAPVVIDTLPSYETFVSASGTGWTCAESGQKLTCTATASLAPKVTEHPIALTATLSSAFSGTSVVNTATVTSTTPDPDPTNNSSTARSTTGSASARLSITKTHTGNFTAGSTGTYKITVDNHGPSDVPGAVTVTDTLPAGESFHATSGTGWTCSHTGVKVTCTLAAGLPSTDLSSFTLTVDVASTVLPGTLVNVAHVASATPDPTLKGTTTTDPTKIVTTANLSITKSHTAKDLFTPGTDGTYVLAVTNAGPSAAAGPVRIVDTLPPGETYVSGTATGWKCAASGQKVTCTLAGGLGAGTKTTVTLVVAVSPGYTGSTLSNTASVSSITHDPTPANNSSTNVVAAITPLARLTVSKTHTGDFTAGTDAVYEITATDTGPSDNAGPVVVTDTLPAGETYASATGTGWTCHNSGGKVTCTLPAGLGDGAISQPITLTVAIAATVPPGTITNSAVVTSGSTQDPTASDTSVNTATVVTSANLSIVKSHTGNFTPGTDATYTLTVANAGPSEAAGPVTVTDTLPVGETYVSATGTGWTCSASGQKVICTLAAGLVPTTSAGPITLTVGVGGAAYPSVTNTVTVSSPTPDPDLTNNSSTNVAAVNAVDYLTITKTHVGTAVAGENLTYHLAVANSGLTADPGPLKVTDTLPAGETYVSATDTGWTCNATGQDVTCTLPGAFEVGATSTITLVVALSEAAVPRVANTATVIGTASDLDTTGSSSTNVATVTPGTALTLTKTLVTPTLVTGEDATYTMKVRDDGPSPAQDVVITDGVPAGLQPLTAGGQGWTCSIHGQVVTCSEDSALGVGATGSVVLTALVTAPAGNALANGATVTTTTMLVTQTGTSASTPPAIVIAKAAAAPTRTTLPPLARVPIVTGHPGSSTAGRWWMATGGLAIFLLAMSGLALTVFRRRKATGDR